ncbi:hypothetical protein VTK56DRAFT_3579 [Thermocarpiscus australiensis]
MVASSGFAERGIHIHYTAFCGVDGFPGLVLLWKAWRLPEGIFSILAVALGWGKMECMMFLFLRHARAFLRMLEKFPGVREEWRVYRRGEGLRTDGRAYFIGLRFGEGGMGWQVGLRNGAGRWVERGRRLLPLRRMDEAVSDGRGIGVSDGGGHPWMVLVACVGRRVGRLCVGGRRACGRHHPQFSSRARGQERKNERTMSAIRSCAGRLCLCPADGTSTYRLWLPTAAFFGAQHAACVEVNPTARQAAMARLFPSAFKLLTCIGLVHLSRCRLRGAEPSNGATHIQLQKLEKDVSWRRTMGGIQRPSNRAGCSMSLGRHRLAAAWPLRDMELDGLGGFLGSFLTR